MSWAGLAAHAMGGACLSNAVPHLVAGVSGRRFQSPFARPPGQGLSSPTVNVLWGFANLVAGYVLVCRVGRFDLAATPDAAALGAGAFAIALLSAVQFGRVNAGEDPGRD